MNCNAALELLLDADPAELALATESPLVVHLRSCHRCRAVAERLHADTLRLADEVFARRAASAPHLATPTRWQRVGAVAAAAVILVTFTVLTTRQGVAPTGAGNLQAPPPTPGPAAPTLTGGAPASTETEGALPNAQAGRRTPRDERAIASRRAAPQPSVAGLVQVVAEPQRSVAASAAAAPASASAGSPSQNVGETRGISVVPPPGMRAMVFATRDPGITIVWLQADDSLRTPR